MQLLDAILAFALTMAALATVVTVIMEACFRIARMRKKNLIGVMKHLNNELGRGSLNMSPEERWNFFSKVVENPFYGVNIVTKINWQKSGDENEKVLAKFLASFGKRKDRKGIYDKVTLEYVLRCLAESDSVKRASLEASDKLKTELNRIARKYEEFGSAVSASFKQSAQVWTIGIGIFLAFAANVDGLRIFEAYRADPKLAAAVIEKHEGFIEKNNEVQKSLKKLKALYISKSEKESEIGAAEKSNKSENEINKLKIELEEIEKKITNQSEIAVIQKTVQDAKNQISELTALGVPIGWDFYPNCPYSADGKDPAWEKSGSKCKDITKRKHTSPYVPERVGFTASNDVAGFAVWVITVIITGILIGLGAPFWFDVAKRLAQIRKGLKNPNASAEDRLSARDANGDAEERKKIVEDVVADAARETAASGAEQPNNLMGPRGLIL